MTRMPTIITFVHQYSYNLSQHNKTRKRQKYNYCKEGKLSSFIENRAAYMTDQNNLQGNY